MSINSTTLVYDTSSSVLAESGCSVTQICATLTVLLDMLPESEVRSFSDCGSLNVVDVSALNQTQAVPLTPPVERGRHCSSFFNVVCL